MAKFLFNLFAIGLVNLVCAPRAILQDETVQRRKMSKGEEKPWTGGFCLKTKNIVRCSTRQFLHVFAFLVGKEASKRCTTHPL